MRDIVLSLMAIALATAAAMVSLTVGGLATTRSDAKLQGLVSFERQQADQLKHFSEQ
jgi:hypothetical protein